MSTEIGRFLLPMRLERLDDGRYIALNRYYKPVGTFSRERVSYETSTSAFRFARQITEQDAINLSFRGESDLNAIVLYDEAGKTAASWSIDSTCPMLDRASYCCSRWSR